MTDIEKAILQKLLPGYTTATCHLSRVSGRDTDATRRLLKSMARRGVVEPKPYASGRVYHWRITDAGRAALEQGDKQ